MFFKVLIVILFSSYLFGELKRFDIAQVVLDYKTGLTWEDTKETISEINGVEGAKKRCENLALGNQTNWRLPTMKELKTIMDKNRKPTIKHPFKYTNTSNYISSTYIANTPNCWALNFLYGTEVVVSSNMPVFARCVK